MKRRGDYLISKERERQIVEEGYIKEHDLNHNYLEFVKAAVSYCIANFDSDDANKDSKIWWPWDEQAYKPKTKLRNLVRAGALIAAAIDRLQEDNNLGDTLNSFNPSYNKN